MNASRAVKTLAGENGTWSASPAQWNTVGSMESIGSKSEFHSPRRITDIRCQIRKPRVIRTPTQSDTSLLQPLCSRGPGLEQHRKRIRRGENDTWDGHQGDRPDLLIHTHNQRLLPHSTQIQCNSEPEPQSSMTHSTRISTGLQWSGCT